MMLAPLEATLGAAAGEVVFPFGPPRRPLPSQDGNRGRAIDVGTSNHVGCRHRDRCTV